MRGNVEREPGIEGSEPAGTTYREVIGLGTWPAVLVGALLVLYAAVTIGAFVKHMWGTALAMGALALVLGLILANFSRLTFEITDTDVVIGYGVFKRRFPRATVTSCEPYELTFVNYRSYVISRGLDGTTAYNLRNGPGVRITFEGAGRPVCVPVAEPAYVCKVLAGGRSTDGAVVKSPVISD